MKKIIFVLLAVMALTYSCKKDVSDIEENQTNTEIVKNNEVINLIKQFETKMQSTLKSGEYIDLDSAVWNMEALQNYSYAYPDSSTRDFVVLKSYYTITVNSNNKVLMTDVQAVNQLMEDTLLYQLSQFPEEVKCMKFWDVNADSVVGTTAFLSATSGFGLNLLLGIYYGFDEDDDWWWGTLGEEYGNPPAGKCDGTMFGVSDGSNEIQWRLNYPAYQPTQQLFYTSLVTLNATGFEWEDGYPLLYVSENYPTEDCLTDDLLAFYLTNAHNIFNTYESNGGLRPSGKDFVSVKIIDDLTTSAGPQYYHLHEVTYGIPSLIPTGN